MPEKLSSDQGKGFVAPDESQRVTNPDKAYDMGRASDRDRSTAAENRKLAKEFGKKGKPDPEYMAMAEMSDVEANNREARAAALFDIEHATGDEAARKKVERIAMIDVRLVAIQGQLRSYELSQEDARLSPEEIATLKAEAVQLEQEKGVLQEEAKG